MGCGEKGRGKRGRRAGAKLLMAACTKIPLHSSCWGLGEAVMMVRGELGTACTPGPNALLRFMLGNR